MKTINAAGLRRMALVLAVAALLLALRSGPWAASFDTQPAGDQAEIRAVASVLCLGAVLLALSGLLPRRWALGLAFMFRPIGR